MGNSKRRCCQCRNYFPVEDMLRSVAPALCSQGCEQDYLRRKRERRQVSARRSRVSQSTSPSATVKRAIRERDGERCRMCGSSRNLHVHHVIYRAQQGPHEDWNLITLCNECHGVVHSSKRTWQPVLLTALWVEYTEGVSLTVHECARRMAADGWAREAA